MTTDKFAIYTGLVGLGLGVAALPVNALALLLLSAVLIFMSLFVQTLSRYLHDQRIGTVAAEEAYGLIWISYHYLKSGIHHQFSLEGDQWMAAAYLVRWRLLLRWMGAGAYRKIDRFEGRCEADSSWQPLFMPSTHPVGACGGSY